MHQDPLSDAQLDDIAARAEAAMKGPWQAFVEGRDHWGGDDFIRTGGFDDASPDMYVSIALGARLAPASPADLDSLLALARTSHDYLPRSDGFAIVPPDRYVKETRVPLIAG